MLPRLAPFVAAALLVLPLAASAQKEPSPAPTRVPPCTTIPVELLDRLDSSNAKIGDRFRFRAIETVVVSADQTKIERQTVGYGMVTYVVPAGAHAKAGQLLLEARYFELPHDKKYEVTVDTAASTEIHSGSNRNAPGIAGAVPIPFVGIAVGAFNYFHAGSNVTVPIGYRFAVTPVGDLSKTHRCVPEFQI